MTAPMKLYAVKGDLSSLKVLVAAEAAGLQSLKVEFTSGSVIPSEAKQKSPIAHLPLLETTQGPICESNAVARYIAAIAPAVHLLGSTIQEAAEVDQWMEYCSSSLEVPVLCLQKGCLTTQSTSDIKAVLTVLDAHLLTRTYIVGERVSLADFCLGLAIALGQKTTNFLKSFPNVARWHDTIANQNAFKKHSSGAAEKGKSAPKPAAAANPAPAAKKADDDEERPPPKKANVLDSLPATTLNLDEWKRCYSNTKDLYGVAMKWFWGNFDPSGWSLWYMKYNKLDDECTVAFVTSNQLGGFLQRVEPGFRKYSFGVIDVVEEKGKKAFDIQGVWMMRGQALPFEMTDHPSFEYHTFQKLDHKNQDHVKLVNDYWCADEIVEGRQIADSKVWK